MAQSWIGGSTLETFGCVTMMLLSPTLITQVERKQGDQIGRRHLGNVKNLGNLFNLWATFFAEVVMC
jgi:hypothetical protein